MYQLVCSSARFNPRARDGREDDLKFYCGQPTGFNPRARDGREGLAKQYQRQSSVSIHAPVMDAKRAPILIRRIISFNPRARDGRELNLYTFDYVNYVSIHAPVMDAK